MNKPKLFTIFIALIVFWFTLQPAIDPDTGWHIATGRFIVEHHQIPKTDIFSYSLPNHPYIAHSWASDILMFYVNRASGPVGLSVLFALITTATLFIIADSAFQTTKKQYFQYLLPLFAYPAAEIIGPRPQAFTVLGVALLIRQLMLISPKSIWQIPLLFFIWSNVHGGVVLGFAIMVLWVLIAFLQKNSNRYIYGQSLILAGVVSLINPYGHQIYTFALGMINNQTSAVYNSDWVPLFSPFLDQSTQVLRLSIVAVSLVGIIDNQSPKALRWTAGLMLLLSFKTIRYVVPLFVLVLPLVLQTLDRLVSPVKNRWWLPFCIIIIGAIPSTGLINKSELLCTNNLQCYGQASQMPYQAIEYIKVNRLNGNIFNFYTWGGYLSWQLPESKVFIDGRMDNFFIGKTSFLQEFVDIQEQRTGWYEKFNRYKTDLVLIPNQWEKVTSGLIENNWEITYQDNVAIILTKH